MIVKKRFLPLEGDLLSRYYPSTKSATVASALSQGWNTLEGLIKMRDQYWSGPPTQAISLSAGYGEENFISTEHKRPQFNNCDHWVRRSFRPAHTVSYYTSTSKTSVYCMPYYVRGPYTGSFVQKPWLDRHNIGGGLRNAQATAWGTMQPRFEGDINLFTFIAELKDFRSLALALTKRPIEKLKRFLVKTRARANKLDYFSYGDTRTAAELHLLNEFAVKPLLSDIYQITCQMEVLAREVQQKFLDAGRERSSRHYTEVLFRGESGMTYPSYFLSQGTVETTTFTATMEYSYNYNVRSSLDAFMAYWGLVPNAEAVWNLIPFSFLVDYIVKIGNSLRVARRDSSVDLNLSQYAESFLTISSTGVHHKPEMLFAPFIVVDRVRRSADEGKLAPNHLVNGHYSSFYSRAVADPLKRMATPRVVRPKDSQILNVFAIARCFV